MNGPEPPPLSPVLLAGLALRPAPAPLLRPFLDLAMMAMRRRHPDVFARLASLGPAVFLIDPVDLPFAFLLSTGSTAPSLRAIRDPAPPGEVTATIRGPLLVLIDLLEGRLDGDAAFFGRDLVVEGSTEAVLTLRNAVDSAEIDLIEDLLSVVPPLAVPARRAIGLAGAILDRAAQDLEMVRGALLGPVVRDAERQAAGLRALERTVSELRQGARRRGPAGEAVR